MKGIKLAILFSSLIFSVYADKGLFPSPDEGTMPSSTDNDSYTKKNNSKSKEKNWKPESDDADDEASILSPKSDKGVFPQTE